MIFVFRELSGERLGLLGKTKQITTSLADYMLGRTNKGDETTSTTEESS